ncbi:MAG: hypothetical protein DRP56_01630 [Planctomycetota bacterium]|nr:MAG: hypothetical protein DRP56_01630 [Planctomycetota bacterium]
MMEKTNTAPLHKFKAGNVTAALWENRIGTDTLLKVSLQKRFQDREGNWKSSGSFARNEIPLAVYCLTRAFEAIIQRQNEQSARKSEDE